MLLKRIDFKYFFYKYVFFVVVWGSLSWLVQKRCLCEVRHCKWWTLYISKVIIKRVRFAGATSSGLFITLKTRGIAYDRNPALAFKSSPGLLYTQPSTQHSSSHHFPQNTADQSTPLQNTAEHITAQHSTADHLRSPHIRAYKTPTQHS